MGPRAALIAVVVALGVVSVARADVTFGPDDVATIFFVDKSDDRNRVDYGIHLDAHCQPTSGSPVVVYWREFEGGRDGHVTHGLNLFEGPVYGVGEQRVIERRDDGVTIDMDVRAIPSRHVQVRTSRHDDHCVAEARIVIAGQAARLHHVHLTLGDGPGSLRYGDLVGTAVEGGARLTERVMH